MQIDVVISNCFIIIQIQGTHEWELRRNKVVLPTRTVREAESIMPMFFHCHLDYDEDGITAAWCRENKKSYFMLSTDVCKWKCLQ